MDKPLDGDLAYLSVETASELIKDKKVSPVELTRACLDRIEALNPSLNAFITVTAESALTEAKAAESEVHRGGWRGRLHGIPVGLKDMIDTAGTRTTAASALFKDRIPSADAVVVARLKRAGAILLGKLNMQEFAYGGTSVPSHFGPTRNPWNFHCMAGGSSGGSAAAVAAGLCYGALGTDTGGSIREPAAFCGVVGMKATYGRVSNRGVIPLAASLDHVGPLARSVEDCAIFLEAICGHDPKDPSSEDQPVELGPIARDIAGMRIGIPREFFYQHLHPPVRAAVDAALEVLSGLGCEVRDVDMEVSTDRTVFRREAFVYHAEAIAHTPQLYLPETLAKLCLGAQIDEQSYVNARRRLVELRSGAAALFSSIDVLVTPTAPVCAPRIEDYPKTFEDVLTLEGSFILRNTRPFNILGIPCITLPCGVSEEGLPIGLQVSGPAWKERRILALARAYEIATAWHERRPAL